MRLGHTPSGVRCVVFLLVLFGTSCATTGPIAPKYLDPSFDPATVDKIVLLSLVDIRRDKALPFDLKDLMESTFRMGNVRNALERKGYAMSFATDFGQVRSMSEEEIITGDATWVNALGPQDANWVLLVGLKDLSVRLLLRPVRLPIGKRATAQCLGVLYNKTSGKAVWYHEAVQMAHEGGLIGMLVTDAFAAKDAFGSCTLVLLSQLPPKK